MEVCNDLHTVIVAYGTISLVLMNGYYLITAGIIAIIIELLMGVATGFDLFIIGTLLVIGGAITLFSTLFMGVVVAVILTIIYFLFGRKIVQKSLSIETKKTNIDRIIGQTALTVKQIAPSHPGQVKIEGEVWRAEGEELIEHGLKVTIVSVSGVTLKVKKI
jgi:membrane protein implicated in regulation of membrane protease activity